MGSVYSGLKVFHYQNKVDSLPLNRNETNRNEILAPIHVRLKPTNICNHNCRYCAYRADSLQLGQDMNIRDFIPWEKMLEILRDMDEMGVKAVTLSGGGEPLCYPNIAELLSKLAQSSIKFACLTNGSKLFDGVAETLAYNGTWVRISMDGWNNNSYRHYRQVGEGEFEKVLSNIRNFAKLNRSCRIGINLVVDRFNHPHVYDFIKMTKALGVNSVKVSPCIISNSGVNNNTYHGPLIKKVHEQVGNAKSILVDEHFEIFDAYHELEEDFQKPYSWCPYMQILTVIGADLNIYTCQDKAYNLGCGNLGSIKNCRLVDFWFKRKGRFFQIDPSIDCRHHCVADKKNRAILDYLYADHVEFV